MAGLLKYKFTKTKKTDASENVALAQIIPSSYTENTVTINKQVTEIPIIPDSESEFPECWDFKQVDISYFIWIGQRTCSSKKSPVNIHLNILNFHFKINMH